MLVLATYSDIYTCLIESLVLVLSVDNQPDNRQRFDPEPKWHDSRPITFIYEDITNA